MSFRFADSCKTVDKPQELAERGALNAFGRGEGGGVGGGGWGALMPI